MCTLSTWISDWIKLRTNVLKPLTVESYCDLLNRYIAPSIGDMPIDAIEPNRITHLLAQICAEGHSRTAELIHVLLTASLRGLEGAPMQRVPRPKHRQKSPAPWSDAQIATYLRALDGHRHQIPLSLALMLGLRRGEICGLRWQDIDFSTGCLHVCNQRVRLASGQIIDQSPKSFSSDRILPVPNALLRLLRARRQLCGYICEISPSALDKAHRKLVERLELPPIPLHGLRHSMATACIRHGGQIRSLQSVLGHSNYAVTANIYTTPDTEMLRSAIDSACVPCYNVLR